MNHHSNTKVLGTLMVVLGLLSVALVFSAVGTII